MLCILSVLHIKKVTFPPKESTQTKVWSEVSLLAMLKPLHSKTNQELYKKHLYNQAATIKNTNGAVCPSYRCCTHLKSEASITLLC